MNLFNKSNVVEEFSNELSKKEESWRRIMKIMIYFKIIHFFRKFLISFQSLRSAFPRYFVWTILWDMTIFQAKIAFFWSLTILNFVFWWKTIRAWRKLSILCFLPLFQTIFYFFFNELNHSIFLKTHSYFLFIFIYFKRTMLSIDWLQYFFGDNRRMKTIPSLF